MCGGFRGGYDRVGNALANGSAYPFLAMRARSRPALPQQHQDGWVVSVRACAISRLGGTSVRARRRQLIYSFA